MFCEKCGTMVPDGTKFCTSCGAPIPEVQPQQADVMQAQPNQILQAPVAAQSNGQYTYQTYGEANGAYAGQNNGQAYGAGYANGQPYGAADNIKTISTWSLVLGILSIVFSIALIYVFGLLAALVSIGMGVVGIILSIKVRKASFNTKGTSALVCSIVGITLGVIMTFGCLKCGACMGASNYYGCVGALYGKHSAVRKGIDLYHDVTDIYDTVDEWSDWDEWSEWEDWDDISDIMNDLDGIVY